MVPYVEHFEEGPFLYLVTKWIAKGTLAQVLEHTSENFLAEAEIR